MTFKARREINRHVGKRGGLGQFGDEAGGSAIVTDLINKTSFGEIVWNAMGDYDHPIRGFSAVLYPTNKSKRIGIHGVPEELVPNYGFNLHLDGSWTGPIPQHPDEVDSWQKPIDYDALPKELLDKCDPIGRQLLGAKASHLGYFIPTEEDCPLKPWFRDRFGETWMS